MNRVVDPASAAAARAPSPEAGTADSGGGGGGTKRRRRRRDDAEEEDKPRGLERVHASAPAAPAAAPRLLLPATSNNSNHCSSATTSWMLLPFEADQDRLTIQYDGEVFWKAGDLPADLEANEFDGYFTRTPAEFLHTTQEEEGGTILDIGAFQRIIRDCGGDEGSAAYVAAVINLNRPPLVNVRRHTQRALHQYAFGPAVSQLFYCFDPFRSTSGGTQQVSTLVRCSKLVTLGEADEDEEDENGTILTHRDAPFTCRPDGALLANGRGFALAMMQLQPSFVEEEEEDGVRQDAMFTCALLTSVTAAAMITRNVAPRVYVPFVVNVDETAILFVAHMDNSLRKAPAIREVQRDPLWDRPRRVAIVATLAALVCELKWMLRSTFHGDRLLRELTTERAPSEVYQERERARLEGR
jgi:hypothetical protein